MDCGRSRLWLGWACLGLLVTAGCGGSDIPRGSVAGTVTFNGTPVEQGTITFVPTEGTTGPATYATIRDGAYRVAVGDRGPIVGTHKVQIEAFRDLGKKHHTGVPLLEQVVPEKYNTQTTLKVTVTNGQNNLDFPLTAQ